MSKNAYHYLYQQETLYRVPEPEPLPVDVVFPTESTPPPRADEVVAEPPLATETPDPVPPRPYVPQVNHQILLLFDEELLPSEQLLLERILKSVRLNLDGVDILNLAGLGLVNVRPVLAGKQVHHVISFGVPFTQVHLRITMNRYEPQQLAGINFLLADPLPAIEADETLKRQLWLCLRKLFLNE